MLAVDDITLIGHVHEIQSIRIVNYQEHLGLNPQCGVLTTSGHTSPQALSWRGIATGMNPVHLYCVARPRAFKGAWCWCQLGFGQIATVVAGISLFAIVLQELRPDQVVESTAESAGSTIKTMGLALARALGIPLDHMISMPSIGTLLLGVISSPPPLLLLPQAATLPPEARCHGIRGQSDGALRVVPQ